MNKQYIFLVWLILFRVGHPITLHDCRLFYTLHHRFTSWNYWWMPLFYFKNKTKHLPNFQYKFHECLGQCCKPQHLAQCLAQSRCSINICEMNKWMWVPIRLKCIYTCTSKRWVLYMKLLHPLAHYTLCLWGHVVRAVRLRFRWVYNGSDCSSTDICS